MRLRTVKTSRCFYGGRCWRWHHGFWALYLDKKIRCGRTSRVPEFDVHSRPDAAGDKVDGLLRGFIAQKESIDPSDNSGKLILADLSRRIRSLKEVLFKTGELEYTLSDDTVGRIRLEDFLADGKVIRFGQAVEDGFKEALGAVDESWLRWLAMDGVRHRCCDWW